MHKHGAIIQNQHVLYGRLKDMDFVKEYLFLPQKSVLMVPNQEKIGVLPILPYN